MDKTFDKAQSRLTRPSLRLVTSIRELFTNEQLNH
jgi:hypothetical protein